MFSTGHPRQYSLAPAMLVCADRTRRGMFIAVWPQIVFTVCCVYVYPLCSVQCPCFFLFFVILNLASRTVGWHPTLARWIRTALVLHAQAEPRDLVLKPDSPTASPCSDVTDWVTPERMVLVNRNVDAILSWQHALSEGIDRKGAGQKQTRSGEETTQMRVATSTRWQHCSGLHSARTPRRVRIQRTDCALLAPFQS